MNVSIGDVRYCRDARKRYIIIAKDYSGYIVKVLEIILLSRRRLSKEKVNNDKLLIKGSNLTKLLYS